MLTALLDLLYPPACIACARVLSGPGSAFCESCDTALERLPPACCRTCAEPGTFPADTCPRCRAAPPPFTRAWAPFAHEGPIARAIHRFKYEDHPELAAPLGALLAGEARRFLTDATGPVVALPLHTHRFRQRQYDQAQLLAGALAKASGREAPAGWLERTRDTRRQVGLSEAERAANVATAFRAPPEVAGRSLVLLDDVFTTGATARAAASALLAAGAVRVDVLTLARAFTLT
ncbi:ComF family protein [Corallococcus sp. M34]|uniref:double zinc ribbon domain-containing protein n=1 Tax=Citreicoccus inhibens TaxID=2849499 RepID=UPI001C24F8B3|nr:double zinc ribbon domain-containing protein [Citreicoccus inhibens]MBU8899029.1 ComF family protein [Citreicoccus inhibens]